MADTIITRVKNSLKRAFTYKQTSPTWYRLDNAASIYSLMSSKRSPSVFRLSCTLKENINIKDLQTALNRILIRFPYFDVNLRSGLFWPFWEKNNSTPQIFPEEKNPCQRINIYNKGNFPFKVKAYYSRIAIEYQHSLTDGTGGLTFLKALIAEYLSLRGKTIADWGDIFRPGQDPQKEEYEYAFKSNYDADFHEQKMREKAYRPPFKLEPTGTYHIISGKLSVKELLSISRGRNVTLTELLAATYIFAHQKVLLGLPENIRKKIRKPIRLAIPVNLRNLFPSKTMRNFSYLVAPQINPKLGNYSFEEILHIVHHSMKMKVSKRFLKHQFSKNVNIELFPLMRLTPLFIKKLIGPFFYKKMGEEYYSGKLSNVGRVTLPESIAEEVQDFEFILAPSDTITSSSSVISFGDSLTINFGRTIANTDLEKYFFEKLVDLGAEVRIETN